MTYDICLKNCYGKVLNEDAFIIADNQDLELNFTSDTELNKCCIILENGDACNRYVFDKLGKVKVLPKFIKQGQLNITVLKVEQGEVIKKWTVEPIVLVELESGYRWYTRLSDVMDIVDNLVIEIQELKERIRKLELLKEI